MGDVAEIDVLVIDDIRTFTFPAVYARTEAEGLARVVERPWREVWLDHDLGPGSDVRSVVRVMEERAFGGKPLDIGLVLVHTSNPTAGDSIVAGLERWYRVRRVVAHDYLAPT
jgi:hypothetical protein